MNIIGTFRAAFELTKWFLLLALLLFLIHSFVVTIFIVSGSSMDPNLQDGQLVLVNRAIYDFKEIKRGDIVVVRYPGDPESKYYVKRVIGLPGEVVLVQDGRVYINHQLLTERYTAETTLPNGEYKVPVDSYFTMGDNRTVSSDSRVWGPAEKRFIMGRVEVTLWPLVQAHPSPIYE